MTWKEIIQNSLSPIWKIQSPCEQHPSMTNPLCQENCSYHWICQAEPLNELFYWVSPSQAQFEFYSP